MYLTALCESLYWGYQKSLQHGDKTKTQLHCNKTIILAMKLTVILLFTACLQVSANTYSQVVTINLQNAPLDKVVKEIERQTKVNFFYEEGLFQNAKPVTISVSKSTLEEALALSFKNQPFDYKIVGKTVFVRKKNIQAVDQGNKGALIDIRGRVVNDKGEPVLASISVKGSTKGTTTNKDGWFVLPGIEDNAILIISGVGIETTEVKAEGKTQLDIAVKISVRPLDEVQMIAYGATTKRFNTANVSSVKAVNIEKQPVQNPLLALQGRVPGLFITQTSGVPGSGITVRIQGQNSIRGDNDPLYVIDGVPFISQMLPTTTGGSQGILGNSAGVKSTGYGGGNPLSYLNVNDIESIEILKDADATSIYGSRAANGAILITTKSGKAGKIRADFNFRTGISEVPKMVKVLNTEQYLSMRREAYFNSGTPLPSISSNPNDGNYDLNGLWDTTSNTNWQKELIGGTANNQNLSTSFSGGSNNVVFQINGTYQRETTVFPGNFKDEKGSIHFNIKANSPNNRFTLQFIGNFLRDNNRLPAIDFTSLAIGLAPDAPALKNSDGTLNWALNPAGASSWNNPIAITYQEYNNKTKNLIGNIKVGYKLFKNIEFKGNLGFTDITTDEFQSNPEIAQRPEYRAIFQRQGVFTNSNVNSWIVEPLITYEGRKDAHQINFLLGSTFLQQNNEGQYLSGTGFTSDQTIRDIRSALNVTVLNSISSKYKYNALFSRLNYQYKQKYIINLNARRDGSSRFGEANKFTNFWSVGTAWILSEEQFMKALPAISFFKVRGSYGTSGSDQISDYKFMNLYQSISVGVPYQNASSLAPTGLTNPYIQWEETKKMQVGLDIGIFKDRIFLGGTYVKNRTSNQLLDYLLPSTTGFSTIAANFPAIVENTAIEFSLTSFNVRKNDFKWQTNVNFTLPKNRLASFPNLENSPYASNLIVGQPLGIFKQYQFVEIDKLTGEVIVKDLKGNNTSSPVYPTDAVSIINTAPKAYGGLQNSIEYKGFTLDFLFQFVKQTGIQYVFTGNPGRFLSGTNNQPASLLDRKQWQKPGDNANFPAYNRFSTPEMDNFTISNALVEDLSYIKLRNVSLSWQLSQKTSSKLRIERLRIYLSGQNLFTITKYKGVDPEIAGFTVLPPLRTITSGIQITL